jgi:hypothetical protein
MGTVRDELISYLDWLEAEGSQAQNFGHLYKMTGLAGLVAGAITSVTLPGWGLAILAISGSGYLGTLSKEGKLTSRILPLPFLSIGLDSIIKGLASIQGDGIQEELIPYHYLDPKEKSDYALLSVLLDDIAFHLESLSDEVTQRVEWNRISRRFHQTYHQYVGVNPDVLAMKADRHQLRQFVLASPEEMRELGQVEQQPLLTDTVTVDIPSRPQPLTHSQPVLTPSVMEEDSQPDLWGFDERSDQEELVLPGNSDKSSFFFESPSRIAMPQTEIITHSTTPTRDIIGDLATSLKSSLIIGVPGSGKGMLMSHLVRRIRMNYPELKIVGLDPKADDKETGYWKNGFDKVFRANNERMDDIAFVEWMKSSFDQFRLMPDGKILIWDEFTISCRRWSTADKASFNEIINYIVSTCSSGDSRRNYIFGIGQIPNASDMGMSGGTRTIFKPIAILSNQDRSAVQQFVRTTFVPTPAGGIEELYRIMDKSPVGRAIYCWQRGHWEPMPELENYSGYDRDSRSYLDASNDIGIEDDGIQSDIRAWIQGFNPGYLITPSKAATSSWVAKGKRMGVLADAKAETIRQWMDQMDEVRITDQGWVVK